MNQGDIYWCTLKAPDKRRPVVILTRDNAIRFLSAVTIAPITTTIRGIASEIRLTPDDGVPDVCAVNLDNIITVPKTACDRYITHLSDKRMSDVYLALHFALGMDRYFDD